MPSSLSPIGIRCEGKKGGRFKVSGYLLCPHRCPALRSVVKERIGGSLKLAGLFPLPSSLSPVEVSCGGNKGDYNSSRVGVGCPSVPLFLLFCSRQNYNSVADYRSSRVVVVCRMSPLFFLLHDGITFERFKLQG